MAKCAKCGCKVSRHESLCEDCLNHYFPDRTVIQVDNEDTLTETERLGLLWCRLCSGPTTEVPGYEYVRQFPVRRVMANIESIIGEAETSWAWWRFVLGKSREEWLDWYITQRVSHREH